MTLVRKLETANRLNYFGLYKLSLAFIVTLHLFVLFCCICTEDSSFHRLSPGWYLLRYSLSVFYPHMSIGKVWIYRLLLVFFCLHGYVAYFSAEEKVSGVKFCTAVQGRPRQGVSHFCELCSPEAQNRTNRPSREGRWMFQMVTPRRSWIIARRVNVRSARVDGGQSSMTYLLGSFLYFSVYGPVR